MAKITITVPANILKNMEDAFEDESPAPPGMSATDNMNRIIKEYLMDVYGRGEKNKKVKEKKKDLPGEFAVIEQEADTIDVE